MSRIEAGSKTVRGLLSGVKYTIGYFQREYKWERRHIEELLYDLETKFLSSYDEKHEHSQVQYYPNYFLGSIVLSDNGGQNSIIDGQQRLTSLTLLLIYLHNLQQERAEKVDVHNLIFSTRYCEKSFNINVPERTTCLEALYNGEDFDTTDQPESVRNIVERYRDIGDIFSNDLKGHALPYFIDWLIENVDLVEIKTHSTDDAYTIFETMNDRGLSLSPTEMLKGYLLSNIDDPDERAADNDFWKDRILELVEIGVEIGKTEEVDFFKAWLRAKYANSIRDRKKGTSNEDFEKIGTEFHKWVRDEKGRIGLKESADFRDFIKNKFAQFSKHYIRVRKAAQTFTPGLEYVFYNARNNFTLQYPLVLAPLRPEDDQETVNRKIRLVSGYIDIFIARRVVNFRTLGYSSIVYTMFQLMKKIRDLDVTELVEVLRAEVAEMPETFEGVKDFYLHQQNQRRMHHLLARMTYHIEQQSGTESSFETYISREIKKPFEIEHVWANKYERHTDEFTTEEEFAQYRNRFGGLLLLPRGFNQSLGADTYKEKVKAYFGQNLLAKSLNEQCYQNNPSFISYVNQSGLPFRPHHEFRKVDIDARQELYRKICEEIWSPSRFDRELV